MSARIHLRRVGAESAEAVHAVVEAAFAARPPLDPPTAALSETAASLASALADGGGLIATLDGEVIGACLLLVEDDTLWLRRFGVLPASQHHGVAGLIVEAAVDEASVDPRISALAVLARPELPATVGFWRAHGFADAGPMDYAGIRYVELRRPLSLVVPVADAPAMRALGARVAGLLRAGDLVVLTGDLGAGKTTFTQGLGRGLGVAGAVTSPTFVIARVHPGSPGGPDLVHVDAYRLGGAAELDDLDLDTSLDAAVTVVEWGSGVAERLSESRLEITIEQGEPVDPASETEFPDAEPRRVVLRGIGPAWRGRLSAGIRADLTNG